MFSRIQIVIAMRSILRHRRRYLAAIFMTALAFSSLVLIAGYRVHSEMHIRTVNAFAARKGHVTVYRADREILSTIDRKKWGLTAEDYTLIQKAAQQIGGIKAISGIFVNQAKLSNGCVNVPVLVTGVDTNIDREIVSDPSISRWARDLSKSLIPMIPTGGLEPLVVSDGVMRSLGKKDAVGRDLVQGIFVPDCSSQDDLAKLKTDPLVQLMTRGAQGDVGLIDLKLAGRVDSGNVFLDDVLAATSAKALIDATGDENYSFVSIWLDSPKLARNFASKLQESLSKAADSRLVVHDPVNSNLSLGPSGAVRWLMVAEFFVNSLVAFALACVVFNFQIIAMLERRSEIGVMRAIGFQSSFIMSILRMEAVLVAILSVIFGIVISIAVVALVNVADIKYYPPGMPGSMSFQLMPDARVYLSRAAFMIVVTVITSSMVAWYECHIKPLASQLTAKP
jgi:ABC-type lipoprotein release transport system permease subunit